MWSGGTALKDGVILYTLNNQRDTTIKPYLSKKVTNAGHKASLRVQSERSGGVPPLSIRGGRSTSFRSALEPNIYYSRSILNYRCAGVLFPAAFFRARVTKFPYECRVSGANDYVN